MDRRSLDKLYKEVSILKGMIAEVRAKSQIWESRVINCDSFELLKNAEDAQHQMQDDLAKYSHRLDEIQEELNDAIELS